MFHVHQKVLVSMAALAVTISSSAGATEAAVGPFFQTVAGSTAPTIGSAATLPGISPAVRGTSGRVLSPVAWPEPGVTVSGFVAIDVRPTGPTSAVKWVVDGTEIGYDGNGAPWVKGWDSNTVDDGVHSVHTLTRQPESSKDAGRWFRSESVTFTVDNSVEVSEETQPAPVGDLAGWRQIFVDDFDTDITVGDFPARVSDRWDAYPSPWRDTSRKGRYAPERVVTINDGVLTKHLRSENDQPLVAALQPKVTGEPKYGSLYGRYEVRFRTDRIDGYKVAWMLWPDSGTNITGAATGGGGNGEIDFPELDLDEESVSGYVHHRNATRTDDQYWSRSTVDVTDWHIYTIEWSPDLIVFLLDGIEVGRTTERVPNTPMHWVLQTETSLTGPTPLDGSGTLEIDWVAAWARDSEATTGEASTKPSGGDTAAHTTGLTLSDRPANTTQVAWYAKLDGSWVRVGWDNGSKGWMDQWNTASVPSGTYRMFTKTRDEAGRWTTARASHIVVSK